MLPLFTATIFLSAGLLFLVQPLVAKVLLPSLGGSPAVWNTCMVFFQLALLLGYGYSHGLTRLRLQRATLVHAALVLLPLGLLGVFHLSPPPGWSPPVGDPIPWLLLTLALTCGLPFLALATTGPLLQRWFSLTSHERAHDPYFLYAASNTGSVLALLSYPFLLEWLLPLRGQQRVWIGGYAAFAALTLVCAGALIRTPTAAPAAAAPPTRPPPPGAQRLRWVLLAAVPSSLVLGVTQYLSTDVAAIPLIWVVPLAIYLLTFVAAFSGRLELRVDLLDRFWLIAIVWLSLCLLIEASSPLWLIFPLHLIGLAAACLLLHRRLALERPEPAYLTGFYVWVAVGGALGGSFNALLGPVLFEQVLEYPLALAAVCFLRPPAPDAPHAPAAHASPSDAAPAPAAGASPSDASPAPASDAQPAPPPSPAGWRDLAVPAGAVALFGALRAAGFQEGAAGRLSLGACVVLVYLAHTRRLGFALGVSALMAIAISKPSEAEHTKGLLGPTVEQVRTFFGVHRVTESERYVALLHGSTMHGLQRRDDPREPLLYYHRHGPAGNLLRALGDDRRLDRVGLVGLGSGAMAAYARPGQRWTFFEIDPEVNRLAHTRFGYLEHTAGDVQVLEGDGRLVLEARVARGELGLLLLDAFSSDAIPTHLLTREALQLYLSRLRPDGLLLVHISNRYFDLGPVLGRLAQELGLTAVHWQDADGYEDHDARRQREGLQASHWVVLARRPEQLPPLTNRWKPLLPDDAPLWTDDYTDLLAALGKD